MGSRDILQTYTDSKKTTTIQPKSVVDDKSLDDFYLTNESYYREEIKINDAKSDNIKIPLHTHQNSA